MSPRQILITGATGTVGREIAGAILETDPAARLSVLIRGEHKPAATERLNELRCYLRRYRPGLDLSRLEAVPGDIMLPFFGLDPEVYETLRRRTGEIVHAAASVRLSLRLSCSRETNVGGTAEVLRFAVGCPALQRLAYVSTAFVAGDRCGRITEEELDCGQKFLNPYEQSKCEAETLVRRFRGRLPVTILRPSIVVGDSRDGHISSLGTIYPPVRAISAGRLRVLPGRGDLRLDLVPVDFVARAAAALLTDPVSVGRTYHLCAGWEQAVPVGHLLAHAIAQLGGPSDPPVVFTGKAPGAGVHPAGRAAGREPSAEGVDDLAAAPRRRLEPFLGYLACEKEFDTSTLLRHLAPGAWKLPPQEILLDRLFSFCLRMDWGERTPWEAGACLTTRI
jgi:nucleoside-diphosphate-sugar epimerase